MPQAQGLLLPHIGELHQPRNTPHRLQQFHVAAALQQALQFSRHVEMVLDGVFAAPGDQGGVGDAGGDGLLHHVLNHRLIHQRQHFLGLGLGGRQKACAEAGHGEHGAAHRGTAGALGWGLLVHGRGVYRICVTSRPFIK